MILFVAVVLVFIFTVYVGFRSWDKVKPAKRTFAVLFLLPHFLLILSFCINMSCRNEAVSVACFTRQFQTAIIAFIILPLPTLVGTAAALAIFLTAL